MCFLINFRVFLLYTRRSFFSPTIFYPHMLLLVVLVLVLTHQRYFSLALCRQRGCRRRGSHRRQHHIHTHTHTQNAWCLGCCSSGEILLKCVTCQVNLWSIVHISHCDCAEPHQERTHTQFAQIHQYPTHSTCHGPIDARGHCASPTHTLIVNKLVRLHQRDGGNADV